MREAITVPIRMPARPKVLPRPCPCGRENGTVQLVIFNHHYRSSKQAVTCRIKHYYPEFYKITKEMKQKGDRNIPRTITGKKKISYKSRWCSFQTLHSIDFVDSTGRKIPLRNYFDVCKDYPFKSMTFSPDESFYKLVKERGWGIKEDYRWKNRYWADYMKKYGYDAFPEDLFLHEDAIPESERLKYSKHRRWGLLPDILAQTRAPELFEQLDDIDIYDTLSSAK
jgi:hypothetical protein